MITQHSLDQLRGADVGQVRRHVRGILEQTPSFRQLAPDDRRKLAGSMVQVLSYLTHPYGGAPALENAARRMDRGREVALDRLVPEWCSAGARLIGGCCRTTPSDIRAVAAAL